MKRQANVASLWHGNPIHERMPEETTLDKDPAYSYLEKGNFNSEETLGGVDLGFCDPTRQQISNISDSAIQQAVHSLDSKFHYSEGPYKTRLMLVHNQFLAGEPVLGQLSLECKSSKKCRLGKITASIFGVEESCTSKKVVDRRTFLYTFVPLQGPLLAPTDAVVAGPADGEGYWQARKGKALFSFQIKLPTHANVANSKTCVAGVDDPSAHPLPGSFYVPKAGGVRYFVKISFDAKFGGKHLKKLACLREIQVISAYHTRLRYANAFNTCLYAPDFDDLAHSQNTKLVKAKFFGKAHSVSLQLFVHTARNLEREASAWVSGAVNYVTVSIENNCGKPITQLTLNLYQKVKIGSLASSGSVVYSRSTISSLAAKKSFSVDPTLSHRSSFKVVKANDYYMGNKHVNGTYKGHWDGVPAKMAKSAVLDFTAPHNLYTAADSKLAQVTYELVAECPEIGLRTSCPVHLVHSLSVMSNMPPVEIERLAGPRPVSEPSTNLHSVPLQMPVEPEPELEPESASEQAVSSDLGSVTSHSASGGEGSVHESVSTTKSTPIAGVWSKNAVQTQDFGECILPVGHAKYISQSSFLSRTSYSSSKAASPTISVPQYQRYKASSPLQRGMSVASMASSVTNPYVPPSAQNPQHHSVGSVNSTVRQSTVGYTPRIPLMSDKVCTIRRKRSLAIDQLIESLRNEDLPKSSVPTAALSGEGKLTLMQATFDSQTTMIHDLSEL